MNSKNTVHIIDIIDILVTNKIITQYISTIWEETDECANQYTCTTVFLPSVKYIYWVQYDNLCFCRSTWE